MTEDGTIDWPQLARSVGSLTKHGEISSTRHAMDALECLLGEENIRRAVDHYVSLGPGSALARSVLWHIRPWHAMRYCHEIYASSADLETRRSAVELLRVLADRRVLPWIPEFLQDPDPQIQAWGFGIVDQLLFSELVEEEEVRDLIDMAAQIGSRDIDQKIDFVNDYLQFRRRRNELLAAYDAAQDAASPATDRKS